MRREYDKLSPCYIFTTILEIGGDTVADILLVNGDIVILDNGDIALSSDNGTIIQLANNRIMMRLGELKRYPDIGNRMFDVKTRLTESGLSTIAEESKVAILQDSNIAEVVSISAVRDYNVLYGCTINYTIRTQDDEILSNSTTYTKI